MVQYDYIRELYFNEGLSIREISRRLNTHRNTVKRALENPSQGYRLTAERESPVNHDFKDIVRKMLTENDQKQPKHQLTKSRMYELLVEDGYCGSYSAFTYLTRKIQQETQPSRKEAFLKLQPSMGVMQVDFGEMIVMDKNIPRKVNAFCAKLLFSKGEFIKIYPRQSTEFFLDGLNSAFVHFGGVPKKIIFDNLRQAVKEILPAREGGGRVLQVDFLNFKSFYCFEAIFCNPAKGNEKGAVENLVKFTRNNYFLPYPEFISFEQTNEWLKERCNQRLAAKSINGTSCLLQLNIERSESFLSLKELYEPCTLVEVKVDSYQLIHVEGNRYSCPYGYVGEKVTIKKFPFVLQIIHRQTVIAVHDRLFGRGKEHLDPYHYLELLSKKPGAMDDALVIQQWKLPEIYEEYHRLLKAHNTAQSKGTREYIEILKLTKTYGVLKISNILKQLDKKNRYSYQEVLSLLRAEEIKSDIHLLDQTTIESLQLDSIYSQHVSPSQYNQLIM